MSALQRPRGRWGMVRGGWAIGLALAMWGAVAAPPRVVAQAQPVDVTLQGIFGNDAFLQDGHDAVVFEAHNRTSRTLRGRAVVAVEPAFGEGARMRHEVPLDLPPGARRRAVFTVFAGSGGTRLTGTFEHEGRRYASRVLSLAYAAGGRSVVLLADPPRLRSGLLDLQIELPLPGMPSSARVVPVPIGVATLDPRTGDPLLPERSVAYATVAALVAEAPVLARASATQRSAFEDWLRSGGRLLVIPRTEGDLRDPALRGLIGDVARDASSALPVASRLVPPAEAGVRLRCGAGARAEAFGCSRALGFGRVYVAAYDANTASNATSPEVRALVQAIVAEASASTAPAPLLRHGGQEERATEPSFFASIERGVHFRALRAALDPNENYRVGLVVAALLLALYVVVVGPLNFAFVARRGRPTLALVTTPALAAIGLALMLAVGLVGKGVRMRYRRVEFAEAMEDERRATTRRYTAYFLTRPAAFGLAAAPGSAITMVPGAGGDVPPVAFDDGAGGRLREVRGRLWQTLVAREDSVADLGGAVSFERVGTRLAFVRNGLPGTLRGAVVVDPFGAFYAVGDVPPGGRVPVPTVARATLAAPGSVAPADGSDPAVAALARSLGLAAEDDLDLLRGLLFFLGGSPAAPPVPTLLARLEGPGHDAAAGRFARDEEHRFVRIVPRGPDVPLAALPPPSTQEAE